MMSKCARCCGEFMGGEPPHQMTVGKRIELYCIDCIDLISWATWNEEEWGPYPSRMQHRSGQHGRA